MSLTDSEYAYLRSELGEADRTDLDTRYLRLGSLVAVAVEVLRERRAALVSDPLTITVQGVAAVNNAENVKAIERQITNLTQSGAGEKSAHGPVPLARRSRR